MLPELFEMDDYFTCMKKDHLYCKVQAKMTHFLNHTLKDYMSNTTQSMNSFDRSVLERSLCIQAPLEYSENYVKAESEKIINRKLRDFQVISTVDYIKCTDGKNPTTFYDYVILAIVVLYIMFVAIATYYEKIGRYKNRKTDDSLMSQFSIFCNWRKKTNLSKNEDYQKLLSMQGLRLLTMMAIILFHSFSIYVYVYILNPAEFEYMLALPISHLFVIMDLHLVLNFFLMSSWLLTVQVIGIVKKQGHFSLKHIGIILINRYCRLITASGLIIIFYTTSWPLKIFSGPLNFDLIQKTHETCKKKFVYDLLFLQNFIEYVDSCNPVSWYLAADFQLYIINIIVLYIWFKLNFKASNFYAAILVLSLILYGYILYIHNSNGIYVLNLRNSKAIAANAPLPLSFKITYMHTYSLFPASLVGVIFGIVYTHYKEKNIKNSQLLKYLWYVFFFGLPCFVFVIDMLEFSRISAAIIGSMTKPLYCFGIAIGIFGMSHNFGGKIKQYFENKYIVILGNFTYCSYICHWIFMIGRHQISPPTANLTMIFTDSILLLTKASIAGIILSLLVEEPGLYLQKKILPQLKNYENHKKKMKHC